MTATQNTEEWYKDHDNILILLKYMVNEGSTAQEIVDVVEKPYNYTEEFLEANTLES